jgi:hypothetical protein
VARVGRRVGLAGRRNIFPFFFKLAFCFDPKLTIIIMRSVCPETPSPNATSAPLSHPRSRYAAPIVRWKIEGRPVDLIAMSL